jgi:energy-coupling factor transporter ATP-binding protein EcfA2
LSIRKGRITNLLVEPDNIEFAKSLSKLESPYSIFSPGLAGVSRTENYVSDGVLLRALARGDANVVLRNILYRLRQKPEWQEFESDLSLIFPTVRLDVQFNASIDQYVSVIVLETGRRVPLDLAGTGLLQSIQILSYLHLFAPKLIILDEPDSHLHPNNQRLLCSLLSSLSVDRDVQVLVTTHSRHVIDTMYSDAKLLWVRDGSVATAAPDDQLEILLELGALDVREKIAEGKYKAILLTEDRLTQLLRILLNNSGFKTDETAILPYNGVTSPHLLQPLVRQIKDVSQATIIVHRDRDYLQPNEIADWRKEIVKIGAEPFVTSEIDIEGYFSTRDYIQLAAPSADIENIMKNIVSGEEGEIISSYVNGRVEAARKAGTIGKFNYGEISAFGASKAKESPFELMKGKKRLAKLRKVLHENYGIRFEILKDASKPSDSELSKIGQKIFGKAGTTVVSS